MASLPSFTVASGSADQTTLNKRNPSPSLLGSHVGRCESVHVHWSGLHVHMCVKERKGEVGRAAHFILRASSGWSLPGDYGTFCKATMETAAFRTHFHPLSPPSNKHSFVPAWPLTRRTPGVPEVPSSAKHLGGERKKMLLYNAKIIKGRAI